MKATDMHTGLTAELLREVLDYSPETGEFRWKKSRSPAWVGNVVGHKHHTGYLSVRIYGRSYQAHRLAWLYMHGEWPVDQVDHINGVRDDNRAVNLRVVSPQVNSQNQRRGKRRAILDPSNPGLLGTTFDRKRYVFVAQINDPGTGTNKYLGSFATAEEAHAAYLKEKRKIHEGNTL